MEGLPEPATDPLETDVDQDSRVGVTEEAHHRRAAVPRTTCRGLPGNVNDSVTKSSLTTVRHRHLPDRSHQPRHLPSDGGKNLICGYGDVGGTVAMKG